MARPVPTEIRIIPSGGKAVPIQFRKPFAVNLTRGLEPSTFELAMTKPLLDGASNPVSIEISAASSRNRPAKVRLDRWYVIGRRVGPNADYIYTLADVRWRGRYNKLTRPEGYNVKVIGGTYRQSSLDNGSPWTAYRAVKDALELLGFEVDERLSNADRSKVLPDTIGDTRGGGWFGTPQRVAIPAMLETIRADVALMPSGKLALVNRNSTIKLPFGQTIQGTSSAGKRELKWAKPSRVVVQFQRRNEGRVEYKEGGTVAAGPGEVTCTSVVPDVDLADPAEPVTGWTGLYDFASTELGLDAATIADRFNAPRLVSGDGDPGDTARSIGRQALAESLVREHWRTAFQMDASSAFRDYADIQLGRLQADGSTNEQGVGMQYVRRLRYGARLDSSNGSWGARFSANVPFTDPAPFVARWLDRANAVFRVSPNNTDFETVQVQPGEFIDDAQFSKVNVRQLLNGEPVTMWQNTRFTTEYDLRVYWHGLQVNTIAGVSPVYEVDYAGAQDGEGPDLYVRAEDITANFQFAQGRPTGVPLNLNEVEDRAEFIGREIMQTYEQQRSGIMRYPGVEIVKTGAALPRGEILGVTIQVGNQSLYDVITTVTIQPEVLPARVVPVKAIPSPEVV